MALAQAGGSPGEPRAAGSGGAGRFTLELEQVAGKSYVTGPEGLGLGGLCVPHDAEAAGERLELHGPGVPGPGAFSWGLRGTSASL